MSEHWVEGAYESGADPDEPVAERPLNEETGVGLGAGEASTFEPEEDEPAGDIPGTDPAAR